MQPLTRATAILCGLRLDLNHLGGSDSINSHLSEYQLGRSDRQSRVGSYPGRALYHCFTWVVPARFLDDMEEVEWSGETLRIPASAHDYLAHKFGEDWQQKKRDRVFLLDDHTMYSGGPETVVPRLERA